jgi:hypothetical protein
MNQTDNPNRQLFAESRGAVPWARAVEGKARSGGWWRPFVNYHRVLSRARWSGREATRLLLGLLIHAFAPTGPMILGVDDTVERRRGKRIKAKGIYQIRCDHPMLISSRPQACAGID